MKRMILSVALVLAVGSVAEARCHLLKGRAKAGGGCQTVSAPAQVKPAPTTAAAPTALSSGCASGGCRTATSSRFRLFR